MTQHYSGEPCESMEREAAKPHSEFSFTAAALSESLRIALGGDPDAPVRPVAPPRPKHVTGPAIRPVGEAFAMAFTSCGDYSGPPVRPSAAQLRHWHATIS